MSDPFRIDVSRVGGFQDYLPNINGAAANFRQAMRATTHAVAQEAEKLMKSSIADNQMAGSRKNAPLTFSVLLGLASHGKYSGSFPQSPLNRNQQIHDNIRVVDLRNGDYFVGLPGQNRIKKAFGKSAPRLARVAAINETGARIKVTEKMRGFFFMALRGTGASPPKIGTVLVIPPRSFRQPVVQAFHGKGFGGGALILRQAERAFIEALRRGRVTRHFLKAVI